MSAEAMIENVTSAKASAPLQAKRRHRRRRPLFERRRRVDYREASIELVLVAGGRLRRFVVLHTESLRLALGQPRRREIDSLVARQEHFELSTSELWALGLHQAHHSLKLLYEKLGERKSSAPPRKRTALPRALGTVQPGLPANGTVCGELLFAGRTDDALFCVEVLEDRRRVRTIAHLDLARALEVADVKVGDTILIEPTGAHQVAIREERTGSHGEGARTLRRARETFTITKLPPLEQSSSGTTSNRSTRAPVAAAERPLGDAA